MTPLLHGGGLCPVELAALVSSISWAFSVVPFLWCQLKGSAGKRILRNQGDMVLEQSPPRSSFVGGLEAGDLGGLLHQSTDRRKVLSPDGVTQVGS